MNRIQVGDKIIASDGTVGTVLQLDSSSDYPYWVKCMDGIRFWFSKDSIKATPLLEVLL